MAWEPLGHPGAVPHRKWSRNDCTEHTSRAAGKLPQVVQPFYSQKDLYFKRHHLLSAFCPTFMFCSSLLLQFRAGCLSLSMTCHIPSDTFISSCRKQLPGAVQLPRSCCKPNKALWECPRRILKPGQTTYVSAEGSLSQGGGEMFRQNDAVAQSFPVFSLRILLTRPWMPARI